MQNYSYLQDASQYNKFINSDKNIISGPGDHVFWNHSPGLQAPDPREEGAFPIQGNIGSLLKQEGLNNYANCSTTNLIGGSPDCTNAFQSDIYTTKACGNECKIDMASSMGIKNFGFTDEEYVPEIHGLHAYKNVRAGSAGQTTSPEYGCYEDIPNLKMGKNNVCEYDYKFSSNTVGDFTQLSNWQNQIYSDNRL
jgi:hypothetical protein